MIIIVNSPVTAYLDGVMVTQNILSEKSEEQGKM